MQFLNARVFDFGSLCIDIWEGVDSKFNIFMKTIQTFLYIINIFIFNQKQCIIDISHIEFNQ